MAKYDVFRLRSSDNLVLDVQSDLLEDLNTRVVVPLFPIEHGPKPAARLNPVFEVLGSRHLLAPQFIATVTVGDLGEVVGNFESEFAHITAALDMVFQGF